MSPQRAFADYLLAAETAPPPGPAQFAVYRNNIAAALTGALAVRFPAVERLVGPEFFASTARAYAAQSPPATPVLIHYGENFPAFIAAFEPARTVPYLADVATLECAWWRAYHAADAEPLAPDAFAQIAPDKLAAARFTFHPSAAIVPSRWPAVSILARQRGDGSLAGLDLGQAETAFVFRRNLTVEVESIAPSQAVFFAALLAGEPLGAALAGDIDVEAALTHLISSRTITDIALS